jgi:hypothetical protein
MNRMNQKPLGTETSLIVSVRSEDKISGPDYEKRFLAEKPKKNRR